MSADTSLTILVVILSITLGVFLILGIVFLSKAIQIANNVKHVTEKAEQIADKAEGAVEMLSNAAAPVAFGRVLSNIVEAVKGSNKKG